MNAAVNDSSGNERVFCRELVQDVNPLFRISSLFADEHVAKRLLPLYALFASVEQLCSAVSDESVAVRKLEWWRGALTGSDAASRDHPVVAELNRSGAMPRLPQAALGRLLDMAAYRIEAPSTPGMGELSRLSRMTGSPQVELELAVAGSPGETLPAGMAERRGLIQLLREDLGRERHSWWVPLDLMAKHGVRREDMPRESTTGAVRALLGEVIDQFTRKEGLENDQSEDISHLKQSDRHLFVFDVLSRRKLQYTKKSSYEMRRDILFRPRAGDLFCCWRAARKFNRQR